jgi:tetratricopeptide (TPR) repeat protein
LRDWAEIAEELSMSKAAREFYRRALRADPERVETLFRYARMLHDLGDFEEALHLLKKVVRRAPDHEEGRRLLAGIYRELGEDGLAEVLCPSPKPTASSAPLRRFPVTIGRRDTARMLDLFSGREIGFAVQEIDPRTGAAGWLHREGSLDHPTLAAHLEGRLSLGFYPIRSDNAVRFGAISVTPSASLAAANLGNPGFRGYQEESVRRHLLELARFGARLGVAVYPEDGGDRGGRVWFFLEEFAHFLRVRRFLREFLKVAPRPDGQLTTEPLATTHPVGLGWTETAVPLPLGRLPSTLRRSLFLDESGKPHEEQLKFIRTIRRFALPGAMEAVRRLRSGQSLSSPGKREPTPKIKPLLRRCPVIDELWRMARSGRVLRSREKAVLFFSAGLLDPAGLHDMLAVCPDYDRESVQKQLDRMSVRPVSCPKIREMIPEITLSVKCRCSFDLRGGKYPSPLLHVRPDLVPVSDDFLPPDKAAVREVARRYARLLQHREDLSRAIARCESVLEGHFRKTGQRELPLPDGRLCRREADGLTLWNLEKTS